MTSEQRAELRKLCEAANSGPNQIGALSFACKMRDNVPALLDYVEKLEGDVAELNRELDCEYQRMDTYEASHDGLAMRVKELEGEIQRLKKENA